MPQAAIYARYSSDHQRDASIEDQLRLCRLRLEREGWERWSPSFVQFGGLIKLFPGVVHAASLLLAVAGASLGNGVGSIV